jgi:hypothetical protein
MMKLKPHPKDSVTKKKSHHGAINTSFGSTTITSVNSSNNISGMESPLHLHSNTPFRDRDISSYDFADGIDSPATGLINEFESITGSSYADGSETIHSQEEVDQHEEKKVDDTNRILMYDDYDSDGGGDNKYSHNYNYNENYNNTGMSSDEYYDWNEPWFVSDPWNDSQWDGSNPMGGRASKSPSPGHSNSNSNNSNNNHNQRNVDLSFDSLQFMPTAAAATAGYQSSNALEDPFDVGFQSMATSTAFGLSSPERVNFNNTTATTVDTSYYSSSSGNSNNNDNKMVKTKMQSSNITRNSPTRRKDVHIKVSVKERLSILFDEATNNPTCRVVGKIHIKPMTTARRRDNKYDDDEVDSFCLTIGDKRAQIEHWDEQQSHCQNITASVPHHAIDPGDQVFLVSLKDKNGSSNLEAPIVGYTCIPRLRPMPMVRLMF